MGFRSGLLQRCFLEFLSDFLLGLLFFFSGIVPGILPEIPLKIILVFLSGSIPSDIPESFEPFQCSFKFLFRPKDSSGFEPGILLGIPFEVSPKIFIKISPGIPSEVPPGIPSGAPPFISSAILPDFSNCEIF